MKLNYEFYTYVLVPNGCQKQIIILAADVIFYWRKTEENCDGGTFILNFI